ncbi:MAG: HD-GYP domain-containing protein [Nitrospirae bacterium]|nr:HD-GYP domain-containing protein [Nitrospirota bacterium]
MPEYKVAIDQLREGVFIRLDLKWFEHPFLFSSFKITSQEQLSILRELGLAQAICIPEKSDVLPLSHQQSSPEARPQTTTPVHAAESAEARKLWEVKKERMERLKVRREKDEKCEKQFRESVAEVKNVMQNVEGGSREAFEESDRLMQSIVASLMPEKESAVQLMNTTFGKENVFFHSLNVAVLSMMLAREYGLDSEMMRILGLGALFHDLGKSRVPKNILHKAVPLTRAERNFYQLHPRYGIDILSRLDMVPSETMRAVYQHHERNDGRGFPEGLPAGKISLFAKIISIVNVYDNHCNRYNPQDSLTPHEALAYMFGMQKAQFDSDLLALFIQCLGVYPPGTIVKLSNGFIGMVISVNPRNPLYPSLMIYNPEIPRKEALIYDLMEEPDLKIEHSIKPSQLDQEAHDYLSPRTRVTYYVAESEAAQGESHRRLP